MNNKTILTSVIVGGIAGAAVFLSNSSTPLNVDSIIGYTSVLATGVIAAMEYSPTRRRGYTK
ncbi:MAG: hypothetical protein KA257_09325 [Opitutaceae bacterium]|nr:hypothetical protein [Opitutaceae bacterium]MBP9912805.1 hypothetical protein [Opitutaceae bacterium]